MSLVTLPSNTGPLQCLIFRQASQNTEDDWCSSIQLNPHQAVRDCVANVLEVHC
jgi:hypothetical protein